jgi:prepilin-type processing-associated H-X9-DG protein
MKRFSPATWVLAAAVLASAAQVRAGALDDRVPQEAIAYFGWAGSDALQAQYAGSNLKGVIEASAIKDFINKTLPKLIDRAAAQEPNAPKVIGKLESGLGIAWRHPAAFYFCPVDFANPQKPQFRLGLICDAGTDAKALNDLLKEALAQVPPNQDVPVHLTQDGNTVMLTVGKDDSAADLKKDGGLAAAAAYKAAMGNVKPPAGTPAMAAYVDVTKIVAMINDALAKIPDAPAEIKQKVPLALDVAGITGLTQVAMVSGFDGKGWSDQSFVGMAGPRKGLLALLDSTPISDGLLTLVPKDAAAFAAWKLDLLKIFNEVRTGIGKVDAPTQQQVDAAIGAANKAIGLNIEKDILAPLGEEWVLYQAPLSDQGGNSPALVSHLKDGATFAKTLAAAEKMYNDVPGVPVKIEKLTTAKTEVSTFALGAVSVAWAVKNDMLYVSSLNGIGGAIRQVENKAPSILESDLYKTARATLPANVKPMSIAYSNPAKLYPELRGTLVGYIPLIREQAGIDLPMNLLPETADIVQFLTPTIGITWMDANGAHGMGKSAFPGADLLGGQQMGPSSVVAVGALGAAVALPALGRARQLAGGQAAVVAAPVNVDAANLRGISQSTLVYAMDHKDALPDDLARLVAEGMLSPRQLVSRRAGTTPLEMTPELEKLAKDDFAKFAATLAAHCDFIYLGKGLKAETNEDVIVAYEKPGRNTPDGLNVAFQDGHAEFVRWTDMAKKFEATNTYLKKNSKPEVDVKAMLRMASVPDPGMP